MLESAAKTWLAKPNKMIPALDILHRRALETLNDKTATFSDLAVIITLDPGMSISLYHQVNSLHDGLHFSKVVMLLFSENRPSLFTYLSKGLVHSFYMSPISGNLSTI